jgi:hypothetical protein
MAVSACLRESGKWFRGTYELFRGAPRHETLGKKYQRFQSDERTPRPRPEGLFKKEQPASEFGCLIAIGAFSARQRPAGAARSYPSASRYN